jgi:N-acyl-D-amino-acid deacylase
VLGVLLAGCERLAVNDCHPPSGILPQGSSFVVENATILDGTGTPGYRADVRVRSGLISEIGELCAGADEPNFDGQGLVLAPGFIDTHSHHDFDPENRRALGAISQGITTIVVGVDGQSRLPMEDLAQQFAQKPMPVNLASFSGHNTLRASVLGQDYRRHANEDELAAMKVLLEADMQAGALGLSSGLEYDPGIYSATSELIELASVASAFGGRYASHIRSEDRRLLEAIEEFLEITRQADIPSQLSHLKIAIVDLWGHADQVLDVLDRARDTGLQVTADVYPYTYWQSTLQVLLPERNFFDLVAAQYALDHLAPADGLILGIYLPDERLVGKSVADIARLWEKTEAETYLQLIRDAEAMADSTEGPVELVIGRSMDERDVERFIAWPHANIASDGFSAGGHPRGYGSFPRALRKYTREKSIVPLKEMIAKMTVRAARNVGLEGRGQIQKGMPADLVLFSKNEITDQATIESPAATSRGIRAVWVNGQLVWDGSNATGSRPGIFLSRTSSTRH